MTTTFFSETQFSWGFQVQTTNATSVSQWQYVIEDADYQIDPTQITNNSDFTHVEINNGNGTYDHYFTSVAGLGGNSASSQYQWTGVNFGFDPSSVQQTINCN